MQASNLKRSAARAHSWVGRWSRFALFAPLALGCSPARSEVADAATTADSTLGVDGDGSAQGQSDAHTDAGPNLDGWAWTAPGFSPWKGSNAAFQSLVTHDNEVLLGASEAVHVALQSSCDATAANPCTLRASCVPVGSVTATTATTNFDALACHGLRHIGQGTFVATGSLRAATGDGGPNGEDLGHYWRATIDATTCTIAPSKQPVPGSDWFIDALPRSANTDILLVGRNEEDVPDNLETPYVMGTGALAGKGVRVAPKQGSDETFPYYHPRNPRLVANGDLTAVVIGMERVAKVAPPGGHFSIWATILAPDLGIVRSGELVGSQGAMDIDGAALSSDGSLIVSWWPDQAHVDAEVHVLGTQGARYLARFDAKGALLWKVPHIAAHAATRQPFVLGHDGSAAIVMATKGSTRHLAHWARLTQDGSVVGTGPSLPGDAFSTGIAVENGLAIAWLEGTTLRVQHVDWPPGW